MAVKLFRLRHVPEDELEEIRALLLEHDVAFYETTAGGWGISEAAIWLHDPEQLESAKALLERYQQERSQRARAAYLQQQREVGVERMFDRVIAHPLRSLLFVVLILLIIYITLAPFVHFAS